MTPVVSLQLHKSSVKLLKLLIVVVQLTRVTIYGVENILQSRLYQMIWTWINNASPALNFSIKGRFIEPEGLDDETIKWVKIVSFVRKE